MSDQEATVKELFEKLSEDGRRVVLRVWELEKEKLHMALPHGIIDDIVKSIKEVVT